MNLNQVTLPVSGMTEACCFYRRLGFTQIVSTPHYARFECPDGGATFSLTLTEGELDNGAVIYFELEDLDERVALLRAQGVEFDQLPEDMPWLWREAVLFDPSGNKVKLYRAGKNRLDPPWRVELGPL
ncbi:VOC family protein [Microbulbifer sediminum]|uniref:VOC family protein n=1 Tax=Microbulbifer sediminum TaxID=2904250 RepID=UPI001F1E34DD|nr:VOC family protein [Microbulbifer sediminum]